MLHRVTTKYVCGVDLHAKTLTGVIMDLEGKIHRKGTVQRLRMAKSPPIISA